MVHRFVAILASSSVLAFQLAAAFEEIGFAQAVGDASKGCLGLQSTFVRTGNNVVFDLGNGTLDAATNTVKLAYTEAGRTGDLKAADGKITYTVVSNGTTCSYPLDVMAGTFLGVQGASKVDNAGVVSAVYDQARSDTTATCNQTPIGPLGFVTAGNFAAAGGRVGSYDPATKKATFVSGFDHIFTVSPSADGKTLNADLMSNSAKINCAYNLKVTEGNILGVAPSK